MDNRLAVKLITLHFNHETSSIDEAPLRAFLEDKQLLQLSHHFFTLHGIPHLTCLLAYSASASVSQAPASTKPATKRNRAPDHDPADGLTADQRITYEALRTWRADRARHDGVPAYVIFSNRELAAVASRRPQSPAALQKIDGIGSAKVERYGEAILAQCNNCKAPAEASR